MNENNSPNAEENQESAPTLSDTEPPSKPTHGWLEQFDAFKAEAFSEIEKVATMGLGQAESDILLLLAVKLVNLAEKHDANAWARINAMR